MKTKNVLMLVLTAFIWGTAFVAQSVGMDYLEPFTFNGVRSLIGGAALIPCIAILQMTGGKEGGNVSGNRKDLAAGGIACGLLLFAATSLQQIGIQYTTAGKAGFITAFYIVIVPVSEKDRVQDMDCRCDGASWPVFSLYDRTVLCWKRGHSDLCLCADIFCTYSCD